MIQFIVLVTLLAAVYTAPAYLPGMPWIFLGGAWDTLEEKALAALNALGNNLRELFIFSRRDYCQNSLAENFLPPLHKQIVDSGCFEVGTLFKPTSFSANETGILWVFQKKVLKCRQLLKVTFGTTLLKEKSNALAEQHNTHFKPASPV